MEDDLVDIDGHRVRQRLDHRDWSERTLARRLGIHRSTLKRTLDGEVACTRERWMAICRELDVVPEWVLKQQEAA